LPNWFFFCFSDLYCVGYRYMFSRTGPAIGLTQEPRTGENEIHTSSIRPRLDNYIKLEIDTPSQDTWYLRVSGRGTVSRSLCTVLKTKKMLK
jgi:hypothetical protein